MARELPETVRIAIVVSHPIQYFAPWYRELAIKRLIKLRVFYCCDLGLESCFDKGFNVNLKWDIPLLQGYEFEFLPIKKRPEKIDFWQIDNPDANEALDRFDPDVVQVYGYATRTNWRVARWAKRRRKPLLLYSDSVIDSRIPVWKKLLKRLVVGYFYRHVDGALYTGDNNYLYHLKFGVPKNRLFPGVLPVDRSRLLRSLSDPDFARKQVRSEFRIPDDSFVVMFCGKLTSRKRPLDLIVASHQAKEDLPGIWALLVGDGPERDRCVEYCKKENVTNVSITGFVNQSEISRFYVASDCLAVTSEIDPHPLVVTEASCFGLPSIVSDKIGCIGETDTAQPDANAFVYPCGNTGKLRETIIRIATNGPLYRRASAAARAISERQDVSVAADQAESAVLQLKAMGPR